MACTSVGRFVSGSCELLVVFDTKEYKHTSMASLLRGTVYRINYDDCYTNEYAALRAQRTVGEEKYDFFEQNCEHAAKWCKTGLHGSHQLESGSYLYCIFCHVGLLYVVACRILVSLTTRRVPG